MEADDSLPRRSRDLVAELARQDLDPFSVAELNERIDALQAEIVRAKNKELNAPLTIAQAPTRYSGRERGASGGANTRTNRCRMLMLDAGPMTSDIYGKGRAFDCGPLE